ALVQVTAGTHATLDGVENREKRAVACKSFEKRTSRIADHLCQFDQAALLIPARANRRMSQWCKSSPISFAESSQRTRQGFVVRHSSFRPYCFHSLESISICHRSRTRTRASCTFRRLAGTSVSKMVQSASFQ